MNKLYAFFAFVALLFIMFTIINIMISLNIRSKQELLEHYTNGDLVTELNKNIRMYKSKLSVLENAIKILRESNDDGSSLPDLSIKKQNTQPRPKGAQKQKMIDSLTVFEKSLGQSFLNVKNSQANYTALLKRVMKQIGLKPTNDDYKNYCLYRSAIGACQIGRRDCVDFCKQDSRGNIFG